MSRLIVPIVGDVFGMRQVFNASALRLSRHFRLSDFQTPIGMQLKFLYDIVALPYVYFRRNVNKISRDIGFKIKFWARLE